MARVIDLIRHTDNDGDRLTSQGVADAMALAERLPGGYVMLVSSGAQRATQTLACISIAHGWRVPCGLLVEPRLYTSQEPRWRNAAKAAGGAAISALREVDRELVDEDGAALAAGLRQVIDWLAEDNAALVAGHSPTNEAAVWGLCGSEVDPLGKGEGVRLRVDGEAVTVEPLFEA